MREQHGIEAAPGEKLAEEVGFAQEARDQADDGADDGGQSQAGVASVPQSGDNPPA